MKAYGGFSNKQITYTQVDVFACTDDFSKNLKIDCENQEKLNDIIGDIDVELLFSNANFNP